MTFTPRWAVAAAAQSPNQVGYRMRLSGALTENEAIGESLKFFEGQGGEAKISHFATLPIPADPRSVYLTKEIDGCLAEYENLPAKSLLLRLRQSVETLKDHLKIEEDTTLPKEVPTLEEAALKWAAMARMAEFDISNGGWVDENRYLKISEAFEAMLEAARTMLLKKL